MAQALAVEARAVKQAVVHSAILRLAAETVVHCAATREIADPEDASHARTAAGFARLKEQDALARAAALFGACEAPFKKRFEAEHRALISAYKKNYELQRRMVSSLITMGVVPQPSGVAGQPSVYSYAAAAERIKAALDSPGMRDGDRASRVLQNIVAVDSRFQRADAALHKLRALSEAHVANRDKRCFFTADCVTEDLMVRIIELVDYRSVPQCILCNRELHAMPAARQRLPHLSVRNCIGYFPHSSVRAAGGVLNFVNKKDVVKVYADFVVRGAKLAGEAGPRTAVHASSRQADPRRVYALPPPGLERPRQAWENRAMRERHAPEEPTGDEAYRVRIPTDAYFVNGIDCTVDLVFSDDRQSVPATRHVAPLSFSRSMLSAAAPTRTVTSSDGVPYPAHLAFKVNALSCEHGGRNFALKVTGRAMAASGGDVVELVAYSSSFLVMANASSSAAYAARPKRARGGGR